MLQYRYQDNWLVVVLDNGRGDVKVALAASQFVTVRELPERAAR